MDLISDPKWMLQPLGTAFLCDTVHIVIDRQQCAIQDYKSQKAVSFLKYEDTEEGLRLAVRFLARQHMRSGYQVVLVEVKNGEKISVQKYLDSDWQGLVWLEFLADTVVPTGLPNHGLMVDVSGFIWKAGNRTRMDPEVAQWLFAEKRAKPSTDPATIS